MPGRCEFCEADFDSYPCPMCGAQESDARALDRLTVQIRDARRVAQDASTRLESLREARRRLFETAGARGPAEPAAEVKPPQAPAPPASAPPRPDVSPAAPAVPREPVAVPESGPRLPEWRPQSVGIMLLLLGVTLLGLAALVFAVVAWPRMDDTQRAMLLAAATVMTGGLAFSLRSRLPSTSESLSGLFLVMLAIDWVAIRRAGVGSGYEPLVWWAIGTAVFGSVSLVLGSTLRQRVPRTASVGFFAASGVLWVYAASDSLRFRAGGVAVVSAMLVVVASLLEDRRDDWEWGYWVALSVAGLFECFALVTALAESSTANWADATASAAVVVIVAVPPALARMSLKTRWGLDDGLVFLSAAELFIAACVLLAVPIHDGALVAACALMATALIALARFGPPQLRAGVGILGAGVAALVSVPAAIDAGQVLVSAFAVFGEPWGPSGAATEVSDLLSSEILVFPGSLAWVLVVATAVFAAGLLSVLRMGRKEGLVERPAGYSIAGSAFLAAIVVFPVWAGWTVAAAVIFCAAVAGALLLLAIRVDRTEADLGRPRELTVALLVLSGAPATLCMAWGAASRPTTLVAVGAVALGAGAAVIFFRSLVLRATSLVVGVVAVCAEAGLAVLAGDGEPSWAWATVCCVASLAAVVVAWVASSSDRRAAPFDTRPALASSAVLVGLALLATAVLWTPSGGWALVLSLAAAGVASFAIAFAPGREDQRDVLVGVGAGVVCLEAGLVVMALGGTSGWAFAASCCAATVTAALIAWIAPLLGTDRSALSLDPAMFVSVLIGGSALLATAGLWETEGGWPLVVSTAVAGIAFFAVAFAPGFEQQRAILIGIGAGATLAISGEIPGAMEAGLRTVAWSVGAVSSVVLLVGVHGLGKERMAAYVEGVGFVGMVGSLLFQFGAAAPLSSTSLRGPAGAATLAVPVLVAASIRKDRRGYAAIACGSALMAVWLWLASEEVGLWEAYTLPAAVLALAAGYVMRKTPTGEHSWVALGPGLVIGFAPSLMLVLTEGGTLRGVLLSVAAVIAVLLGARYKLQAPMEIGALTLVVLGIDLLWPVVARAERWIVLGIAGIAFLWLGATIEKRLRDVRRVRHTLEGMK